MAASIWCPYTPSYGLKRDREPRTLEARFGDGYAQRAAIGINNAPAMMSMAFQARTDAEAREIEAFFESLGGVTPFYLETPGEGWSVTDAGFGVGDSTRTQFQLQRTARGSAAVDGWSGVWPVYTTPRTNLCLQSQDFSTTWSRPNLTTTVNAAVAPDGTLTADLLTETTAASTQRYPTQTFSGLIPNTDYVGSIFVKPNGRTRVTIDFLNMAGTHSNNVFDLTGAGSVVSGTGLITALPNGWYWIRCTVNMGVGATTPSFTVLFVNTGANTTYTGDGVSGLYFWGAQVELGTTATAYIPTTTVAVTVNPTYWEAGGSNFKPVLSFAQPMTIYRRDWQGKQQLYPTARTNLSIQSAGYTGWSVSQASLTQNGSAAPDGTTTATTLTDNATNSSHYAAGAAYATTTGAPYTATTYLKAGTKTTAWFGQTGSSAYTVDVDLAAGTIVRQGASVTRSSITAVGNGWWRVDMTALASGATMLICVGAGAIGTPYVGSSQTIFYWGCQAEAGTASTSYIPTTTVAVAVTDYTLTPTGLVTPVAAPLTGAVMTFTGSGADRVQYVAKKWGRGWDATGKNTITVEVVEDFA